MDKIKKWGRRLIATQLVAILALSSMHAQQTSIFHLLQRNDTTAVRALLDANPIQANACLDNGLSALMAAVVFHNLDMAELLISRGAVVRCGDDHLRAAIHYANWGGDKDMIELLLANGAPVDTRAIGGASPLIHSSLSDNFEMCKFLIEKGADIHIQCNALVTPLYLAVLNGNLQYADYLLKAGAEAEVPDFLGRTPLAVAVRDGNRTMAEKLVENGADLFFQDRFLHRSLLHLASIEGHEDVVGFLISKGLVINSADDHGMTPLDYAHRYGHTNVAKLLQSRGAKKEMNKNTSPGKESSLTDDIKGVVRVIKMQNGSWALSTASAFFLFGYSEIGEVPASRSILNGYMNEEVLSSGKKIYCIDHNFHPDKARYTLEGSNPLYSWQKKGKDITFILNPAYRERYSSYDLKKAVFAENDSIYVFTEFSLQVLPSYRGNACYVFKTDDLTIVWLTGICDNYMTTIRDTAVIEDLLRRDISPDILLAGSPTGLGPEIAHGIRETIKAAEILKPKVVFILGHEPLERKVLDQLRRQDRDISRIQCAENPGDCFLFDQRHKK